MGCTYAVGAVPGEILLPVFAWKQYSEGNKTVVVSFVKRTRQINAKASYKIEFEASKFSIFSQSSRASLQPCSLSTADHRSPDTHNVAS